MYKPPPASSPPPPLPQDAILCKFPQTQLKSKSSRKLLRWTPEEDERLRTAVVAVGEHGSWKEIARRVGTKCPQACYQHWFRTLDSRITRSPFSTAELYLFAALLKEYRPSPSWTKLAYAMSTVGSPRTGTQLRTRWLQIMQSRQQRYVRIRGLIENATVLIDELLHEGGVAVDVFERACQAVHTYKPSASSAVGHSAGMFHHSVHGDGDDEHQLHEEHVDDYDTLAEGDGDLAAAHVGAELRNSATTPSTNSTMMGLGFAGTTGLGLRLGLQMDLDDTLMSTESPVSVEADQQLDMTNAADFQPANTMLPNLALHLLRSRQSM